MKTFTTRSSDKVIQNDKSKSQDDDENFIINKIPSSESYNDNKESCISNTIPLCQSYDNIEKVSLDQNIESVENQPIEDNSGKYDVYLFIF